ncbi:amidase [Labrys sp. KB_33_2]|uniref:amidase n=1 Tax=Labrys sp. KB_33_2 TaxID=3237479 RepID=UPI003F8E1A64
MAGKQRGGTSQPAQERGLSRRGFLNLSAKGLAGAASAALVGQAAWPGSSLAKTAPSDIVMMDAIPLSQAIKSKSISCVEVMTAYLDHIDRLNPTVNAIVSRQERGDLLKQAGERDAQLGRGDYAGWMHGFPQAIKDLADTKGIRTTQGSPLFKDRIPQADALFVDRMKHAGSIIIGKTNTPEFGLGSQTYNQVFGTTLNAYDHSKTAGGSSGGAAVSLAMRMLPVADGSDHAGSLRNPSAYNNVLGFRTSFGRVPSPGADVFDASLGVNGPMARNVSDLALLLAVQSGYHAAAPLSLHEDPTRFTEPVKRDLKGVRIAWLGDCGGYLPFEPGVLDLCRAALKTFEALGCTVEEARPDYPIENVWRNWLPLRAWQTGSGLKVLYDDPAKRALLKPEAQWEIENYLKLSAVQLSDAAAARTQWYQAVRTFMERYDYFILPSAQVFPFDATTHWPKDINGHAMDTYHRWMEVVIPVTMSGCPAMSVPVGFNDRGLPMGMQLVGRNHAEMSVLQLAYAYEQATGWPQNRLPPALKPA